MWGVVEACSTIVSPLLPGGAWEGGRMESLPVRRVDSAAPSDAARVNETGRRPIRLIGLLLLMQAVGLAGIVAYELSRVDWRRAISESLAQVIEAAVSLLFVPSAVLALLAALGFLLMSRRGWILAALSQGASLAICLWLYSGPAPLYVYGVMVYCILMILYLNSQDVRVVFHHPGREARGATRDD